MSALPEKSLQLTINGSEQGGMIVLLNSGWLLSARITQQYTGEITLTGSKEKTEGRKIPISSLQRTKIKMIELKSR